MIETQPAPFNPGATLDWACDWAAWLAVGDSIATHAVAVSSGLTKGPSQVVDGVVTVRLTMAADAELNQRETATFSITTASGQSDSRTIHVRAVRR